MASVAITEDTLSLTGPNLALAFEPIAAVPEAAMVDIVWVLETVSTTEGATNTIAAGEGEEPNLLLDTDGIITGSTGCRAIAGRYIVTAGQVFATNLATSGDCQDALEAQDAAVMAVLGGGFSVEIDVDVMTLSGSGSVGLVYRRR